MQPSSTALIVSWIFAVAVSAFTAMAFVRTWRYGPNLARVLVALGAAFVVYGVASLAFITRQYWR